jgi:hypothetical protein
MEVVAPERHDDQPRTRGWITVVPTLKDIHVRLISTTPRVGARCQPRRVPTLTLTLTLKLKLTYLKLKEKK